MILHPNRRKLEESEVVGRKPVVARRNATGYRPLMAQEDDMRDQEIRAALDQHWAASDADDFELEHSIYREDAVLEYPQSGERIRGHATYKSHARSSRVKSVSLCGESVAAVIFGSLNTS